MATNKPARRLPRVKTADEEAPLLPSGLVPFLAPLVAAGTVVVILVVFPAALVVVMTVVEDSQAHSVETAATN